MQKQYHFKAMSLIPANLRVSVLLVGLLLLYTLLGGTNSALQAAEKYGGLWVIGLYTLYSFAQAFAILAGHKLEITNDTLIFRTLLGTKWQIPVQSIQQIDPEQTSSKRGDYFMFMTDGKKYTVPYALSHYGELLADLRHINPRIALQRTLTPLEEIGGRDMGDVVKKHLNTERGIGKFIHKITGMNVVMLFVILVVLAVFFIVGALWLDIYMRRLG